MTLKPAQVDPLHKYMYIYIHIYMGGCQNYGAFLGPYYNTAPII